jgi:hypothetical protein
MVRRDAGNRGHACAIAHNLRTAMESIIFPTDLETKLTRKAAAEVLTAAGYPTSRHILATKASRGGGPLFQRFGRVPLYRWGDCLDWAHSKLSAPMHSTSEADAP